ncbi:MAG TPA: hypothetical protein VFJ45_07095 [bacterium]|nr:hypothetical protein [bacterium]
MDTWLLANAWYSLAAWTAVAISDYFLTLYGAQLYQTTLGYHVTFQGSYELTPMFQADVDARRRWSPRFVRAVIATNAAMLAVWFIAVVLLGMSAVFAFMMGGLILRSLSIHLRHLRNIALARFIRSGEGVSGKVEYARWLTLRLSAVELLSVAGLFGLLALAGGGWAVFGGAAFNLITGLQHWAMSDQARRRAATVVPAA